MENSTSGNSNKKNKYETYIVHIQWKYFHVRITNDEIKISQLKAIFKK